MILFFWKGKWKVNFQFILKSYSQSRVALIITFLAGGYVYCLGFKLWEHVEWPRAESLEPGFRSIPGELRGGRRALVGGRTLSTAAPLVPSEFCPIRLYHLLQSYCN